MAILQVGSGLQLRSASTGTKEEDYENDAATIVQKCVSIQQTLPVYLCVSWDNKHKNVFFLFAVLFFLTTAYCTSFSFRKSCILIICKNVLLAYVSLA